MVNSANIPPPERYPPKLVEALHGWAIFEIFDQDTGQPVGFVVVDPEMTQVEKFETLDEAEAYLHDRADTDENNGGGSPSPPAHNPHI